MSCRSRAWELHFLSTSHDEHLPAAEDGPLEFEVSKWRFPKIRGTILGVPIVSIIVSRGLYSSGFSWALCGPPGARFAVLLSHGVSALWYQTSSLEWKLRWGLCKKGGCFQISLNSTC